jgi:hypothetical protein
MSDSINEQLIIKIITDNWRLMNLFLKVLTRLDVSEANRYMNQIRYFQKTINDNLNEINLKIINLEGQLYDPGMAASPLNIDDFLPEDKLIVEQMLEPLIMGEDGIKKQATVKLMKVQ